MRRSINFVRTAPTFLAAAAVAVVVGGACGDDEPAGRLRVVTTTELAAEFVRHVGEDRVDVVALLPPGADPHTFEPSPSDVARISQADLVFANGLDLEGTALDLIEANIGSDAAFFELADEIASRGFELIGAEGSDRADGLSREGANPHVWLDPEGARLYLQVILDRLTEAAPADATNFERNRDSYADELDSTVAYLEEKAEEVSADQRVLVTTHDAFPYFARAIGFEIGGFVAEGPGQEPSPRVVADLAEVIEGRQLKAVFREPQVGPETDVLEQAAADAGADVCVLLSDAFEGEANSYAELVRHNADELVRCLGG